MVKGKGGKNLRSGRREEELSYITPEKRGKRKGGSLHPWKGGGDRARKEEEKGSAPIFIAGGRGKGKQTRRRGRRKRCPGEGVRRRKNGNNLEEKEARKGDLLFFGKRKKERGGDFALQPFYLL